VIIYQLEDDGISYSNPLNNQPSGPLLDPLSGTATVTATVYPVNNPPVTTTHRVTGLVEEDTPTSIPVSLLIPTDALVDSLPEGSPIPAGYDSAGVGEDLGPNGVKDAGETLFQRLSILSPVTGLSRISTTLGGFVDFLVDPATGKVNELFYTPPVDFASVPSSNLDSFNYRVIDDGKSFLLDSNGDPIEIPNSQKTSVGRVEIEVLPLNDRPQFNTSSLLVESVEDSGENVDSDFAFNITAGPISATDEVDDVTGQDVDFIVTPLSFDPADAAQFFDQLPAITPDGELSFTPAADAFGEFRFEVVLVDDGPNDPAGGDFNSSIPVTMTINVAAVNDPPTFVAGDPVTVDEDAGPYNQGWASNISPGPANESTQRVEFEVVTPDESLGLFETGRDPSIDENGVLRFTTAQHANGVALVEVTAVDSAGGRSQTVTLQINVNEVNDPPLARPDDIDTDEDAVLNIPVSQLLANDFDPDLATNPNEKLTLVMPEQSFSLSGAFITYDAANGVISYDPTAANALQALAPGESLLDSFSYFLVDAAGAQSNVVTVALDVAGINDAPDVRLDTPQLDPDAPTIIRVLDNDRDVDGFIVPSTLRIELPPAFGSADVQPDGTIIYTSFGGSAQEDVFTYTVADNLGQRSRAALVTISTNASPIAVNDAKGTFLDEPVTVNVAANDSDPDGSLDLTSVTIVTAPLRGQAIPQNNGTVQYVPDPGFLGRDSFQYQIADNAGRVSNVATVNLEVVASRLQNPDLNADVNDDGAVSALDALLIINRIDRADGATSIPVLPNDRGPNFYDVNGNQQITAGDALVVINELSRINNSANVGSEQVLPLTDEKIDVVAGSSVVEVNSPEDLSSADKILDTASLDPVSDDVLDLIASDRDHEDDEDNGNDALDAAFALLL
jgi:VCBS repeat-containing protein